VKNLGYVLRWILTVFLFVMAAAAGAVDGARAALLVFIAALIVSPPVSACMGRIVAGLRAGWGTKLSKSINGFPAHQLPSRKLLSAPSQALAAAAVEPRLPAAPADEPVVAAD
jgi:hypothetical protein